MMDHIGITVSDLARARRFYAQALESLGVVPLYEIAPDQSGEGAHIGFGVGDRAFFWIRDEGRPASGLHIAFMAPTRAAVDAFHVAALRAGGVDNGPPGLRPHYDLDYYGAFVLDPHGVNVEAVCRAPG
jgi:catechol 2,3-dioxygenase-like lactoylglutathione lyase family enzyme